MKREDETATSISDLDRGVDFYGQVSITPEEAMSIYDNLNVGNRRVRRSLVLYLRGQIESGEWQEDHPQPIVFSSRRLIDGQHRLLAIAESGKTVRAFVRMGARDSLREYIDTGINRDLSDRVEFSTDPTTNRLIATLINTMTGRAITGREVADKTRPTPTEAMNLYVHHRDGITFAVGYMHAKVKGVASAPVMIALVEMFERDPAKAKEFADALVFPDGPIQPARRLRDFLLQAKNTSGWWARRDRYLKSVGAMRTYLDGRNIVQLRSATWE